MLKNRFLKNYLSYFLVVLAIVLPWFFHSGYLFFTDSVWGPKVGWYWQNTWWFLQNLFQFFGGFLHAGFSEKVLISLVLFTVLLGAKKLLEYFIDQKWLVFIISLFFLFNPFVYDRLMYGQFGVALSLGLLAWGFGFFLEFTRELKTGQLIWSGALLGLSIAFCLQAMFFVGLLILICLIRLIGSDNHNRAKTIFKSILIIGALILVFNLNWILGSFMGKSNLNGFVRQGINHQDLVAFQTTGEGEWGTIENVVMMSGFWGKEQNRYIDLTKVRENWGRSFYLLLPLILLGIYVGLKDKKYRVLSLSLVLLFLTSAFLAVGIKVTGAREVSIWLFDHLSLYHGFREPQKWVMPIVLVYGIFLVLGAKRFFQTKIVEKNKILIAIILGMVVILQTPLLLWGFGGQIKPVNYPRDWYEANDLILHNPQATLDQAKPDNNPNTLKNLKNLNPCASKILFLPWHMYMSFPWDRTVSINPAGTFFTCDVIVGTNMEWGGIEDNSLSLEGKIVPKWVTTGGKTDLLKNPELNIGYIVLAKTLDWNNFEWLDNYPFVEKIQDTENLKVYHVK
ncbi:MAG: hypothetical protein PHU42_03530 [Patescibacteria group bacterium]|nr:hypothetical protein [Patescibacteria group bacterium]